MVNDSPPARDGVIAKIKNSTTAQLWIVVAVGVAFFLAMRYLGIAGDCGPHDHDGQCGMGAFFMQVFGAIGAIIIWVGASGQILWAKRRRERRLRSRRLHRDDFIDTKLDRGAALLQNRLDDDRQRDARGHDRGERQR
jgi:hypothetical protein